MFTAASMAMVWGEDLEKARVAGLLHDCAKCIPNKKKITMCEKNKIEITEFERNNPFLIHAKLGAFLAKDKYKVEDPEILSAITWHTTGKEDMTLLEKIIYIADYIEPARNKAPHLTRLRKLAFTDIDECMYEILKDSMAYLSEIFHNKGVDHLFAKNIIHIGLTDNITNFATINTKMHECAQNISVC